MPGDRIDRPGLSFIKVADGRPQRQAGNRLQTQFKRRAKQQAFREATQAQSLNFIQFRCHP